MFPTNPTMPGTGYSTTGATVSGPGASVVSTSTGNRTGVASTGSSITSSATGTDKPGLCKQISNCIANVVSSIFKCLSHLPLIGGLFGKSNSSGPNTGVRNTGGAAAPTADQQVLQMFTDTFNKANRTEPAADVIHCLLEYFKTIQNPAAKMFAFYQVLTATNSSDAIAKAFYNALPEGTLTLTQLNAGAREASKTSFRHEAYKQHGSSIVNGHDHGLGFGDFVVKTAIRSSLAQETVKVLVNALTPRPSNEASRSATTTTTVRTSV